MTTIRRTVIVFAAAAAFAVFAWTPVRLAAQTGVVTAITGARIVTGAGATIANGTIVVRNGVIDSVGANATIPPGAFVIDAAGLTVYPGLIDLANSAALEAPATDATDATAGRGGRGATETLSDLERAKRTQMLRPDFDAAEVVGYDSAELRRLASAGITSVLAVPSTGLVRGRSALIDVAPTATGPDVSRVGSNRRGVVIVKAPVAEHVSFNAGRSSGPGANVYPGSLLGVIAFIRQSFSDAAWQRDARSYYERHKDSAPPAFDPALDALAPALAGAMPVAFDAGEAREILRALGLAKEFSLTPIIVGGIEASAVVDDLRTAKARVIYSVNFDTGERGGSGGRGGTAADIPIRTIHLTQNAPKVPAALDKAGIEFAFTSGGLATPADFVRNVARTVKEGGLPADVALRALTSGAAKIAGVGDRLGTIEKGKIANLVVTDGDLFANGRVRYVFVDGQSVAVDAPAQFGGRGGYFR